LKIPKSFVSDGNLDKNIAKLVLTKPKYNPSRVNELLESCDEFVDRMKKGDVGTRDNYPIAEEIVKKLDYTKEDLEALCNYLWVEDIKKKYPYHCPERLGFYLSALINKVVPKGDSIRLKLNDKLDGIGAYLDGIKLTIDGNCFRYAGFEMKSGEMIVKGDAGAFTGQDMNGGKLIVEGNVDRFAGYSMRGGGLIIKGDADSHVGNMMYGGVIFIEGEMGYIGKPDLKAKIYHKGIRVWPK